jgi:hypothetical protein
MLQHVEDSPDDRDQPPREHIGTRMLKASNSVLQAVALPIEHTDSWQRHHQGQPESASESKVSHYECSTFLGGH